MQQEKTIQLQRLKDKMEAKEDEQRLIKHSLAEVQDKNSFNKKDTETLKFKKETLSNKQRALVFMNSQIQGKLDRALIKDERLVPMLSNRNKEATEILSKAAFIEPVPVIPTAPQIIKKIPESKPVCKTDLSPKIEEFIKPHLLTASQSSPDHNTPPELHGLCDQINIAQTTPL